MAGFEHYANDVQEIEREIERKGIALGIDWTDPVQVHTLAREALHHSAQDIRQAAASGEHDYQLMAKVDLFGLAAIMLKTMAESAEVGIESHGGVAWKAFAKALWIESGLDPAGRSAQGKV